MPKPRGGLNRYIQNGRITPPIPLDKDGIIINGFGNTPYLPADPGRRRRLLRRLNATTQEEIDQLNAEGDEDE